MTLTAVVVGSGAVGARAARQLASSEEFERVIVCDRWLERAEVLASSLGTRAQATPWAPAVLEGADVMIVAGAGDGAAIAAAAIEHGVSAVSVADSIEEVRGWLELDEAARGRGVSLVVGAGMGPGLSCVLARYASTRFARVDEVHVARMGTGGPACARQHHRVLSEEALDWRNGAWERRPGRSGRELCWFPDPVRGLDCYRAGLPDALLLVPAFAGVRRVTARMAATRRDRLSAGFPMLRRPHTEGEIGALRVEVRGMRAGGQEVAVLGVVDRPAVAAGAVAAVTAVWAGTGRLARTGAGGLAELVAEPGAFLAELSRRGVKVAWFEGQ